ncbi:hypothetical protein ABFZ85_02895 [Hyphococcus formosus]|uniref:hypothetical protein n=1 Tax=Hyphococcus formosus TaxID=3143534 RepID=UPI00398B847C
MTRRLKLMTGLSTLAAVSALSLAGCGGEGDTEGEGEAGHDSTHAAGESEAGATAAGESEGGESEGGESEGGESEGGESEGEALTGDPASSDIAYLHLLGLARGHLIAFHELYGSGSIDMALMHVKHPESELYASLAPAFDARKKPGMAQELRDLAAAADARGEIEPGYEAVVRALDAHAPDTSVANVLLAVSKIVRTAADEYDIGVEDDGLITNAHEYQDAYGFLIASREILAGVKTNDMNATEAINLAQEQIDVALTAFDGLTAEKTEGAASTLYGAAARIEIAGRGL